MNSVAFGVREVSEHRTFLVFLPAWNHLWTYRVRSSPVLLLLGRFEVVANIVQDAIETSRFLETSSKDAGAGLFFSLRMARTTARQLARENRQNAGIKARTLLRMIDEA